jgi:hypothetical protein
MLRRESRAPESADAGAEPELKVPSPPGPYYLRRKFLIRLAALAVLPLTGAGVLVREDKWALPLSRVEVVKGKVASKREFLEDPKVQRILMKHGIRLELTTSSSREIAVNSLDGLDFAFPSGQPGAMMIVEKRRAQHLPAEPYSPFLSPIVLATFRDYAETLRDNGVARPLHGDDSLYYELDLNAFIDLTRTGRTWNNLGITRYGPANGNRVLANTPDICASNSGATYLGMVAYAVNGNRVVQTPAEADAVAEKIKPLLTEQGLPSQQIFEVYVGPDGRQRGPIVVVYEHQFFTYQLDRRARSADVDRERVLMYPQHGYLALPQLIAFTPAGNRLGHLITNDPELRGRAAELGFRLYPRHGVESGAELRALLEQQGIPTPVMAGPDDSQTRLPILALLDRMVVKIGCPESAENGKS